jgi:opacity protein-like surface antigen
MKRTLILAALAASLAAPVAADTAFAVQHFNMDQDSVLERNTVPSGDNTVFVSTRNGSALNEALSIFNADQDTPSDIRGLNGATVVSNSPAHGADIFAALRAESLENE